MRRAAIVLLVVAIVAVVAVAGFLLTRPTTREITGGHE
jgi:uncharacterized membrane protein